MNDCLHIVAHEGAQGHPPIADHELLRRIGGGSYGEVWLARSILGTFRAVKIVYRHTFGDDRPFEREFTGIQKFEPISRSHESQVAILHVGRSEDYFNYRRCRPGFGHSARASERPGVSRQIGKSGSTYRSIGCSISPFFVYPAHAQVGVGAQATAART